MICWPAFAGQLSEEDWSRFAGADVVVIGEIHDNPFHHANQARAVAALEPAALVFEQITPELARSVTPELVGDAVRLEAALDWEARGWPDFAMYYPIFAAAPGAAVFGGGAPVSEVRRAVSDGAATVFGGSAELFGLEEPFPEDVQTELEELQRDAHCNALPTEMLSGMVEAQRLRDAALARAALAAHHESESRDSDAPVVVITGNGHAGNAVAVPKLLRDLGLKVISVGQFEESVPQEPDFDYWLVTDAAERDDPCEAFR